MFKSKQVNRYIQKYKKIKILLIVPITNNYNP